MNQSETSTSSGTHATLGVETIDPKRVRAQRNARRVLLLCLVAFVASTVLTVAAVVHNDMWPFAAIMNKARPLTATAAFGFIVLACAYASKRVRPSIVPLVSALAIIATLVIVVGHSGVRGVLRPLWNTTSYDAAIVEYADTFWASQEPGDEIDAATAMIRRVSSDEGASDVDIRAAIDACDLCIKRLDDDIAFLTNWPTMSRSRLRELDVPTRRAEWYANAWERTRDLNALIETSTDASATYQGIRRTLQSRIGVEPSEPAVEDVR